MKDLKMREFIDEAGNITKSESKTNHADWHVMYAEYVSKSNEIIENKGLPLEEWRTF
jgi:post-segregation antitoxin (ccd killing protein)